MHLDTYGTLIPHIGSQGMKRSHVKHLFYFIIGAVLAFGIVASISIMYTYYAAQQDQAFKERVYRTQLEHWTERLSTNARLLASDMGNTQYRLESYALRDEIHDTVPPARYERTHFHLVQAIDYYVEALEDKSKAIPLLKRYDYEINQAEMEYEAVK